MKNREIRCIRKRGRRCAMRAIPAARTLRGASNPKNTMHLLMEYTGSNADVDDPYYYGNFTGVCRQIEEGCKALLQNIAIPENRK